MKYKLQSNLWKLILGLIVLSTFALACKKDKFEESKGVCPEIIATNPLNGALAVPLNQIITATLNESMNPATMVPSCFELSGPSGLIAGTFSYNDAMATITFVPTVPLNQNTTYGAKVKSTIRDMRGNALQKDYAWSFSTGIILTPIVLDTDPDNLATGILKNQVIKAFFNYPMDPNSITDSSFRVTANGVLIQGTVTCIDSTATFTPNILLQPSTIYVATITTNAKTLNKGNMPANYSWTFTTEALIPPVIISTTPLHNATGVSLNPLISAKFSVPMNGLTIKDSSFYLMEGTNKILGSVSYSDSVAVFTPSAPLTVSKVYVATITTLAKNMEGASLPTNYSWTFTTFTPVPPTVVFTDPITNATEVGINKTVRARFSAKMDPSTMIGSNMILTRAGNPVAGVVAFIDSTISFNPTTDLLPNTLYTCSITNNVKNLAGTNMTANYIWSFTTAATIIAPTVILVDPLSNATNVALNKNIQATFSIKMDPLTMIGSNMILTRAGNPVAGMVSYVDSIITFNPNSNLLPNTVYTCTLTTGVKNQAGTAMVANYVWSFTTVNAIPPTIITTDPLANAIGVPLNKTITAEFSTAMNPTSIQASSFSVTRNGNPVAGLVSYNGLIASFDPTVNLVPNSVYVVTVTNDVENLAGTNMTNNYTWSFTTVNVIPPTVISTDPINLATNVLLNKVVTATFSEAMDVTSLTNVTFTLKIGTTPVTGVVNMVGNTARFTPTFNLLSGNTYTATITTGAQNLAGTNLANNYVWTFSTKAPAGPIAPNLNSAARFGILAGVGVSNNAGFSVINNMDVGIYPGARTGVTGFPPATIVNGAIYAADDITPPGTPAMLNSAKLDLTAAYLFARDAVLPAPATVSGDQGGLTLAPGIYKTATTLLVQNGNLTLDAQGDVNAVWIFQIGSALTTVGSPTGGSIILTNGAQAKNIYWQVSSSATIGDNTQFKGNVLALTSITMNSNAVLTGRVLCSNGSVVMTSTNIINKP